MQVERLWLTDFRSYAAVELEMAPGLTAVLGPNGQGKTNLLEALGWLATLSSFRGATSDALVRSGAPAAYVRAEGHGVHRRGDDPPSGNLDVLAEAGAAPGDGAGTRQDGTRGTARGRRLLIEAEITPRRHRVQINRQRLGRARDLLGVLRVTVFAPDDLALIKAGPAGRREFLDTTLVALDHRNDALVHDVERILRQRNALLRQCGGRLGPETALTLDVWDAKLAPAGEALADARHALVERLAPGVGLAYAQLAGLDPPGPESPTRCPPVGLVYLAPWREMGLVAGLEGGRAADVARAVTLVGPHRDELSIELGGLPSRSHASQGEQRCLALALKLAAHRLVTDAVGEAPLLLLDDVFSELDPRRCAALIEHLPEGQAVLTSADRLPAGTRPERSYRVEDGQLRDVDSVGGRG
jgi:DNA replication and repair protein RecF